VSSARAPERSHGRDDDGMRPTTIEPGFVRTATGSALQATAERTPLSRAHLDDLLALAAAGIGQLGALRVQAIAAGVAGS